MNLIDSHKNLSNTSGRFLRLLNNIVDTVPSACVLLSVGYWGVVLPMRTTETLNNSQYNVPFGFAYF
jgi:hypothetical protein